MHDSGSGDQQAIHMAMFVLSLLALASAHSNTVSSRPLSYSVACFLENSENTLEDAVKTLHTQKHTMDVDSIDTHKERMLLPRL